MSTQIRSATRNPWEMIGRIRFRAGSGYSETFIPDSRTVGVNEVAGEFGFLCVDDINACKFNRLECPGLCDGGHDISFRSLFG